MNLNGINVDYSVYIYSFLEDMFIAHINSMDTLTRGLIIAGDILEKSEYLKLRQALYESIINQNI